MNKEYQHLSEYYDLLHHDKDYKAESAYIAELIHTVNTRAKTLLDLACGTGKHIQYLKDDFQCEGLDLSSEMIAQAKQINPSIVFHRGDIRNFSLDQTFDAITYLFNSVAYLSRENLVHALKNIHSHLASNGVFILETIFTKETLTEMDDHIREYRAPDFHLKRLISVRIHDDNAVLKIKYYLNSSDPFDQDVLEVPLYILNDLQSIIESAGFTVTTHRNTLTPGIYFCCTKLS